MAHYLRIRNPGLWIFASVVQPAEFEQIDANLYGAIAGDAGGTWTPSTPIIIAGNKGLRVIEAMQFGDPGPSPAATAFTILPNATVTWQSGSFLTVAAGATFTINGTIVGAWTATGLVTFAAGAVISSGQVLGMAGASLSGGPSLTDGAVLPTGEHITFNAPRTFNCVGEPMASLDTTKWAPASATSRTYPYQVAQAYSPVAPDLPADQAPYSLPLPDGATITAVIVTIKPVGAHAAIPENRPTAALWKLNVASGTQTFIASATDLAGSVPLYETTHTLTIPGLSEVVDADDTVYVVRVDGESGVAAELGLLVNAPRATYTLGKLGQS